MWVFKSSTFTINLSTRIFFCCPDIEFYQTSCAETKRWLREAVVFYCMIAAENQWSIQMNLGWLGQTCLFPSLWLARRLQKKRLREKKSRTKRAPKSRLTVVLESWLLSIIHCRDLVISVAHFPSVSRWCRKHSGIFRNWRCIYRRGDWWAVEGASHSCYQEPGTAGWGPQHDILEAVHSRGRKREVLELLERSFDDGKISIQMRNLLALFHVDSNFSPLFCFFRSARHRSSCHCNSCHWSSDGFFISPICEEEKAQLLSPLMNI